MAYVIPGSISTLADQAKAAANAAVASAQPSYTDMLSTIKSGAIFKDTSSQLGALTNIGVDSSTMSGITTMVNKAKANMGIDMAVSNAALAQAAKEAQAAGTTLTDAAKEAAMGPMNVLKNLQSKLASSVASVSAAVSSHASTLGASLTGANPVTDVNAVASAATAFKATIPVATIDGTANPAFTAFSALAANIPKLAALSSIAGAAASAGASLLGSLGSDAAAAASAKASTISTLKADSMLSTLTKAMPSAMAALAGNNLNLGSIDSYAAIKAQEAPVTIKIEKTPDTIRSGMSSLVVITGVANVDTTNLRRIWTYELKALAAEKTTAITAYYGGFGSKETATADERSKAMNAWLVGIIGPAKNEIRKQSLAIKAAKPNVDDRTTEEISIVDQSATIYADIKLTPQVLQHNARWDTLRKLEDWYIALYKNWIGPDDRFTLNAELLAKISKYTI